MNMVEKPKIVEQVILSFQANRAAVEEKWQPLNEQVMAHQHGRLCFSWRSCRQRERLAETLAQRISDYKAAEDGLETGDYTQAISQLREIAHQMGGSGQQVVEDIIRNPSALGYLNSRSGLSGRMLDTANELEKLQSQIG